MKRIFQLIIFSFFIGNTLSQILPKDINLNMDEIYDYPFYKYRNAISTSFFKDIYQVDIATINFSYSYEGLYYISLIAQITNDMLEEICFSYGKYIRKGNTYILKDAVHRYKIVLKKKDKDMVCISGPNWLLNKTFNQDAPVYNFIGLYNNYDLNLSYLRKKNAKKYANNDSFLIFGVYRAKQFFIDIQPNRHYSYYYNEELLLEGSWEKKGNELLLYTSTIPWTFSMLITKEGLVSQLLPGDFEGLLFKKID